MKPIWDLSYKWESDTNPFRAYEGNDKQKCTDSNASPYVYKTSKYISSDSYSFVSHYILAFHTEAKETEIQL